MSLNLLLRINSSSCLILGLVMLLKTDLVNLLIGTEKTMYALHWHHFSG